MLSPTPTPTKPPVLNFYGGSGSGKKREVKKNPLMRNGEEGREMRRKLFLKRVKEGGEEKRWMKRGGDEEMARKVYFLEERREKERVRREVGWVSGGLDEEIEEEEEMEMEEVDEVLRREQEELEVLVRERECEEIGAGGETPYGSDEEEYDDIFMDVIQQEMLMSSHIQSSSQLPQQLYELSPHQQTYTFPPFQQSHTDQNQDQDHDMMDMS